MIAIEDDSLAVDSVVENILSSNMLGRKSSCCIKVENVGC